MSDFGHSLGGGVEPENEPLKPSKIERRTLKITDSDTTLKIGNFFLGTPSYLLGGGLDPP